MEIINKLEMLNKKNTKSKNTLDEILSNENYETITREDVLVTYVKVFLFTLVLVVLFDTISKFLFTQTESSSDGLFVFALIAKAIFISASFFPILFCNKNVLANTKDFFVEEIDGDTIVNLILYSLLPLIISFFLIMVMVFLPEPRYYLDIFLSFLDILYFITLFCFSVFSIFQYYLLPTMEKGIKTKQEIKIKKQKHQKQIDVNNLKINKYILEYCKTVDDIEYLELLCDEKDLIHVLNKLVSIKENIAKENGFQNFKEMKVNSIKNKKECLIVNE